MLTSLISKIKKDSTSKTETIILAILFRFDTLCGLEIKEHILKSLKEDISTSSIYNSISKLQNKGFIEISRISDPSPERGGKRKFYFKITKNGEKALNVSLEEMENIRALVDNNTSIPALMFSNL